MTRFVIDADVAIHLVAEWPSTFTAEYVALTLLQADAFVTLDAALARNPRGDRGDGIDRRAASNAARDMTGWSATSTKLEVTPHG